MSSTHVTLFRIEARDITLHNGFSMVRPVYDETQAGIEALNYVLPDGYSVGELGDGSPAIFDPADRYCQIETHSSGRPQLVSAGAREMPVLQQS